MVTAQGSKDNNRLKIINNHWYAWQTVPADLDETQCFYSPVHVNYSTIKGKNKSHILLAFTNVLHLDGAQDFHVGLKILRHYKDILVADLFIADHDIQRVAIVSRIDFGWLQQHCRHVIDEHPPSLFGSAAEQDVATYLDRAFPYVHSRITSPKQPPEEE
ncbi:hypothetical protein [Halomonas sp. PR-M31]|uniref:hypothetical protein n=1 Tax=Halomonas sp. PR-M31 TaxID=1471202 RepID=UPI0006511599|nr:hypothetical protein [Halomonas sp. PR-M31]